MFVAQSFYFDDEETAKVTKLCTIYSKNSEMSANSRWMSNKLFIITQEANNDFSPQRWKRGVEVMEKPLKHKLWKIQPKANPIIFRNS